MSIPLTQTPPASRPLRSVWAVFASFLVVFILSLGTDQVLHMLNVYPPWGQPMFEPGLNALALSYRLVFGVIGGYVVAGLAPHSPMKHAIIGGVIGLVLSSIGAAIAISKGDLGPSWYPIALALSAIPTSWAGAKLYLARARG